MLGLSLALCTALIWGALPVVLKVLVQWVDVYTLAWTRFLLAGALLTPILVRQYGWRVLGGVRRAPLLMLVCIGGLCGNYVTYLTSLRYVSPGAAQVVMQLTPMLVLLGGLVISRETFTRTQWLGFGLLVLGIGLFLHHRYGVLLSDMSAYTGGVLLLVLSAGLWAAYILSQKQLQAYLPPEGVLLFVYAAGVVLMLPLGHPACLVDLDGMQLGVLGLASVMTVTSYVCFGTALNHLEASRTGVVVALTPLMTMGNATLMARIFPDLLGSEGLTVFGWVGVAMVIFGSMLGALGGERGREKTVPVAFEECD